MAASHETGFNIDNLSPEPEQATRKKSIDSKEDEKISSKSVSRMSMKSVTHKKGPTDILESKKVMKEKVKACKQMG
jgi:hypothetical protein